MKSLMGSASIGNAEMQTLANRTCEGNIELLADKINEFLISVSSSLPRLYEDHPVFNIESDIPYDYIISVITTEEALSRIKPNKAMGPDNVPGFVLRANASVLAAPLACLFNSSLREGVVVVNLYSHSECMQHVSRNHVRTGKQPKKNKK